MVAVQTDGAHMYVPVPKVATTSLRKTFPDWRATDEWPPGGCPLPGFILVRDPVERWFSGVFETGTYPHPTYDELLDEARETGRMEWDNHTKPQASFVRGYDTREDVDLVRLESATDYVSERFGRRLAWKRAQPWEPATDLIPAIRRHYYRDVELYEAAQ